MEIYYKQNPTANVGIGNFSSETPSSYSLYQNYPNPFNPATTIRFDVPGNGNRESENGIVAITVYDILGKEITTLINEKLNPGSYEVTFDGSGLSSGIYFYRLTAFDKIGNPVFNKTRKMIYEK